MHVEKKKKKQHTGNIFYSLSAMFFCFFLAVIDKFN